MCLQSSTGTRNELGSARCRIPRRFLSLVAVIDAGQEASENRWLRRAKRNLLQRASSINALIIQPGRCIYDIVLSDQERAGNVWYREEKKCKSETKVVRTVNFFVSKAKFPIGRSHKQEPKVKFYFHGRNNVSHHPTKERRSGVRSSTC